MVTEKWMVVHPRRLRSGKSLAFPFWVGWKHGRVCVGCCERGLIGDAAVEPTPRRSSLRIAGDLRSSEVFQDVALREGYLGPGDLNGQKDNWRDMPESVSGPPVCGRLIRIRDNPHSGSSLDHDCVPRTADRLLI